MLPAENEGADEEKDDPMPAMPTPADPDPGGAAKEKEEPPELGKAGGNVCGAEEGAERDPESDE